MGFYDDTTSDPTAATSGDAAPISFYSAVDQENISKITEDAATVRAMKYTYALGSDAPAYPHLSGMIQNGTDNALRQAALDRDNVARINTKTQLINSFLSRPDHSMDPGVMDTIDGLINSPNQPDYHKYDTILEQKYAEKIATRAGANLQVSNADAKAVSGDLINGIIDHVTGLGVKREALNKLADELDGANKDSSFLKKTGDFVEQLIPFASQLNTNVGEDNKFLMGENFKKIRDEYWSNPNTPEAVARLKEQYSQIVWRNPDDAQNFIRYLSEGSEFDRYAANFQTVADAATLGLASGVGRMIGRAVKMATMRAPNPAAVIAATDTLRAAEMISDAQKTMTLDEKLATGLPPHMNPALSTGEAANVFFPSKIAQEVEANLIDLSRKDWIPPHLSRQTPGEHLDSSFAANLQKLRQQYPEASDSVRNSRIIPARLVKENVDKIQIDYGFSRTAGFSSEKAAIDHATDVYRLPADQFTVISEGGEHFIRLTKTMDESLEGSRKGAFLTKNSDATPSGPIRQALWWMAGKGANLPKTIKGDMDVAATLAARYRSMVLSVGEPLGKLNNFEPLRKYLIDLREGQRWPANQKQFELEWSTMHGRAPTAKETAAFTAYRDVSDLEYLINNMRIYTDRKANGFELFHFRGVDTRTPHYQETGAYQYAIGNPANDVLDRAANPSTTSLQLRGANDLNTGKASTDAVVQDVRTGGVVDSGAIRAANDTQLAHTDVVGKTNTTGFSLSPANSILDNIEGKFLVKMPDFDPIRQPAKVMVLSRDGQLAEKSASFVKNGWDELSKDHQLIALSSNGKQRLQTLVSGGDKKEGWYDYVLVSRNLVRSEEIPFVSLPYVAGGHKFPKMVESIAQPLVNTSADGQKVYYRGDANLFGFEVRGAADKWATKYDDARKILAAARYNGMTSNQIEQAFIKLGIPESVDAVRKRIHDLDAPIVVRRGRDLVEENTNAVVSGFKGRDIIDTRTSPHSIDTDQIRTRFALERGTQFHTIDGTMIREIERVDPFDALRQSANSVIRGTVMDDFKTKAAVRFVEEFGHLIDAPKDALRANPWKYLEDTPWLSQKDVFSPEKMAAISYATQVREFLKVQGPIETRVRNAFEIAERGAMTKTGSGAAALVVRGVGDTLIDVPQHLGSLARVLFLGATNIAQTFVQASGMHRIVTNAPETASRAIGHAFLMRMSLFGKTDELSDQMAQLVKTVGQAKADQYKESFEAMKRYDFHAVKGTSGVLDNTYSGDVGNFVQAFHTNLIMKYASKLNNNVLEAPYTFGESLNKIAAWNSAYYTWRDANPLATLTDDVIQQKIIPRATIISGDVGASGKSYLESTVPVVSQFMQYPNRLFDQFWSAKQLGIGDREKWQSLLVTGTMFGVGAPAALVMGYGSGFFDPQAALTLRARELGINVNEDSWKAFAERLVKDGVIHESVYQLTGERFDISRRYGPNQNQFISDIVDGKNEALLGPAYTGIKHIMYAMNPMIWTIKGISDPDSGEEYNISPKDWVRVLSMFNSVKNVNDVMTASAIGKYVTRNGTEIDGITTQQMLVKMITGVNPSKITETFDMLRDQKSIDARRKQLLPDMKREYERVWDPKVSDEERHQAAINLKALAVLGFYSKLEMTDFFKKIGPTINKDLSQSVWDSYIKRKPEARELYIDQVRQRGEHIRRRLGIGE